MVASILDEVSIEAMSKLADGVVEVKAKGVMVPDEGARRGEANIFKLVDVSQSKAVDNRPKSFKAQ